MTTVRSLPPSWGVILLAGCCLAMLAVLPVPLIHNDDAFYATAARNMLTSGDWLTLRFPTEEVVARPPLTIWLLALSLRVGGDSYPALRLWHALMSVALMLAVYRLARLGADGEEAVLAAVVYGTFAQVLYHSLIPQQDVPMMLFIVLALADYIVYRAGHSAAALRAAVWVALAVLTKGILALAVFGVIAAADAAVARRGARPGHRRWNEVAMGLLVCVVIAAPWFVVGIVRQGRPFVDTFLLGGDLGVGRYFHVVVGPPLPLWQSLLAFLPMLTVGMLPWVAWLPGAVREGWRAVRDGSPVLRLCALWAGVYLLAISLSPGDKELRYLLPVYPPLAVLVARFARRAVAGAERTRWVGLLSVLIGIPGVVAVATQLRGGPVGDVLPPQAIYGTGAALLFGTVAGSGVLALVARARRAVVVAAAGALIAYVVLTLTLAQQWEPMWPWRAVAAAFHSHYRPGDRLLLVGDVAGESSYVYYYLDPPLNPPMIYSYSFDEAAFLQEWRREGRAFALMAPDIYRRLHPHMELEVLIRMRSGWVFVLKR